jgi:hypothetical protein
VDPESARLYFEKFASKTGYAHLKTSDPSTHKVTPALQDNELDFETVFDILSGAGVNYVAIELPPQATVDEVAQNLKTSVAYLKSKL